MSYGYAVNSNYLNSKIDYTKYNGAQNTNAAQADYSASIYENNYVSYPEDDYSAIMNDNGEKCTDGKDDGKISLGSKIWNSVKGVGKTIVNGVKGMVTDKDGNFSLGKTLLSAATIGACIAFPAVGVALCAVGAVSGAVQVGKGIYQASQATTDAEAKEAWQNIGGGTFTVAASVAGAKAGVKSMGNAAATTEAGSALQGLEEGASMGQKLSAFGKDAVTSSKVGWSNLKGGVSVAKEAADYKIADVKAQRILKKGGALTESELSTVNQADARAAFLSDEAQALLDKGSNAKGFVTDNLSKAGNAAKEAAKHPVQTAGKALKAGKNAAAGLTKETITGAPKAAMQFLQKQPGNIQAAVDKFGYENTMMALGVISAEAES